MNRNERARGEHRVNADCLRYTCLDESLFSLSWTCVRITTNGKDEDLAIDWEWRSLCTPPLAKKGVCWNSGGSMSTPMGEKSSLGASEPCC